MDRGSARREIHVEARLHRVVNGVKEPIDGFLTVDDEAVALPGRREFLVGGSGVERLDRLPDELLELPA